MSINWTRCAENGHVSGKGLVPDTLQEGSQRADNSKFEPKTKWQRSSNLIIAEAANALTLERLNQLANKVVSYLLSPRF